MLGLFGEDPTEPKPRFTFSSLLALLAGAYSFYVELMAGWAALHTSPVLLLVTPVLVVTSVAIPIGLTIVLSAIAIYFGPARWGLIALGLIALPPLILSGAMLLGLS